MAARLGVSEITVKRYLSGRSVTIPTLEALAALVNLDLLSLAAQLEADQRWHERWPPEHAPANSPAV